MEGRGRRPHLRPFSASRPFKRRRPVAGGRSVVSGRPLAMAANRVGRRLGRASPARSGGLSPGGTRSTERTPSPGIQRRQARVTVKYDRRELQRRLDTEKWIDVRLEELYRGQEAEMPDEVNIDTLLEMATDEERAKKLQGILESCHSNTEEFIKDLLEKLRGLRTEHVLRRMSPSSRGETEPGADLQDRA
ncbi:hypothetical protein JRQ81_011369 [Phrynocephalus forsythii]|uniref:Protein phosphatase 1 regulatory subunit 14A n=1 Tax=Phrynocephalus forsythii TaxID=171643 RepID=A0A9Q0X7Q5_9SAUR|nr:hypothetical protein JRQ81_011369 [Phrynocephalus forsythii]